MKETEAAQALIDLKATLEKINAEVQAKLDALAAAIAAQENVSPEVETALADLQSAVKGVDDLIPDAPAEPIA